MPQTTARRFERLNADLQLFAAAVDERAEALLADDPKMSASSARMAARERLLRNGDRSFARLVPAG